MKRNEKSSLRKTLFKYSEATTGISTALGVAIFYDIFIAGSQQNITDLGKASSEIHSRVEEQMSQIAKTNAATYSEFNMTIYYVTIGPTSVVDASYMKKVCNQNGLYCRHLRHHKYSDDDRTLAPIFGYCKAHPDDKVIYMHTRGMS